MPGLPRHWEGRRIALIADLQVGPWWANKGTVRRAIERLVRERPEAVLAAGDLIYGKSRRPEDQMRTAVALLRPLPDAQIPTYAVLGNHDHLTATDEAGAASDRLGASVASVLDEAGIRVVENEAVPLATPEPRERGDAGPGRAGERVDDEDDEPLYLVGLGAHVPGRDDADRAFAALPAYAPRIVLMHNPQTFRGLSPYAAPFALAGHTHGGQIRVPFRPRWIPSKLLDRSSIYDDGWLPHEGNAGNLLYVNRGLGFSLIPVRFGCPPEVTIFTLTRGA